MWPSSLQISGTSWVLKTSWQTLRPDHPRVPFWWPGGRGSSRESGHPGLCQDSGKPEDLPGDLEGGPLLFNILSLPIFCRCQYFVAANILLLPIFCLYLDFKG
jgi:hypothetical protein